MKSKLKKLICCLTAASCYLTMIQGIDNAHFYKAPDVYAWPNACRFDGKKHYDISDWETKIDFCYGYGSTKSAWDYSGKSTSLLNTPGNQSLLYFLESVTGANTQFKTDYDFLHTAIASTETTNTTFGQLEFKGKFKLHDFNLNIRQNLFSGLFLQLLTPIKQVSLKEITFEDKSPDKTDETPTYNKENTDWIRIKNTDLNTILNYYDFKNWETPFSKTSLGDMTFIVGWQGYPASNKEKGINIGLELKLGLLMPTGSEIDPNYVFSIPTGYNGHWGVSFEGQAILEYKEWFALNANVGSTYFMNDTKDLRLKTNINQQGFIKLMKASVNVEEGLLWHLALNAKLDHIFQGFSALVGYSFSRKEIIDLSELSPGYESKIVNSDTVLRNWQMNTLHFMIDYDFSVHMPKAKAAPRLNLFYNYMFSGKNTYKNNIFGGGLGLDVRWSF